MTAVIMPSSGGNSAARPKIEVWKIAVNTVIAITTAKVEKKKTGIQSLLSIRTINKVIAKQTKYPIRQPTNRKFLGIRL